MSNIFEYKWTGPQTRWEYRLRVIPAGSAPLDRSTADIIPIPEGAVNLKSGSKDFDTLPLGLTSTPVLKLSWNLFLLPDDLIYNELDEAINNPLHAISVSASTSTILASGIQLETGTIYELDVKYKGNDDSPQYRSLFKGVQLSGLEDAYNEKDDTVDVEIESAGRLVLESIDFSKVNTIVSEFYKRVVTDYSFTAPGETHGESKQIYPNSNTEGYFHFIKLESLTVWIETVANSLAKYILRDTSAGFGIQYPLVTYYKQTHDGTGSQGTSIAYDDIYLLAYISRELNTTQNKTTYALISEPLQSDGALELNSSGRSIFALFKNAWDFINDWYQESLTKGSIESYGVVSYSIFGNSPDDNVELNKDMLEDIVLKYSAVFLNTVKSINEDTLEGDLSEYETSAGYSRDEGNYTLPVIFDNTPSTHYDVRDRYHTGGMYTESTAIVTEQPISYPSKARNLYYLTPVAGGDMSNLYPYRVHEHCLIRLGYDITSDDLLSISDIDYPSIEFNERPVAIQNESGKMKIAAESLHKLFTKRIPGFNFKTNLYEYTSYITGGSIGFLWWQFEKMEFRFNCSELRNKLSYMPQKWYGVSTDINFENETVEIATVGRQE